MATGWGIIKSATLSRRVVVEYFNWVTLKNICHRERARACYGYTKNWAGCLTSSRPFYYRIPIRYHHYWGNFIGHRNIRGREINCRTCDKGRLIRFVTFNECVNERLTSEKIRITGSCSRGNSIVESIGSRQEGTLSQTDGGYVDETG